MRVNELVGSLLRRPLAMLLVLLVASGGAYYGWTNATNTYQSSATVLIVPAGINTDQANGGTPDNPLTRLDSSITQLALVVGSQLDSDAVREQVVAVGGDGTYSADTLSSENSAVAQLSPLVTITASSATPDGAQRAIAVLITQADAQLAAVQSASNVAPAAQAKAVVSTPAAASAAVGSPQLRAAGVLGVAAGLAALLLMVLLLPLFRRQRSPASAVTPAAPAPEQVTPVANRAMIRAPHRPVANRPEPRRTREGSAGKPAVFADAGRFADLSIPRQGEPTNSPDEPAAGGTQTRVSEPSPADLVHGGGRRRQEVLRDMVRDDWQRSGSNVAWSRREQREAYQRAEDRLAEMERRRGEAEIDNVSRLDDFLDYRDHG